MILKLSQRDPRWASKRLGASQLTVGRYGCTTTCISMLSSYFGCYKTPIEIADHKEGYTADGLVLWSALTSIFHSMSFEWRQYDRNDLKIKDSLARPNKAVILQVNDKAHWVVALRYIPILNDYWCIDPWTGGYCLARGRYRNITGSAHFAAK